MVKLKKLNTFDLEQISQSGQCFRLREISPNHFIAITKKNYVLITVEDDFYIFNCSEDEYNNIWIPYFDLLNDYEYFQKNMLNDLFLKSAIEYGGGIRILQQDFWEMLVTFIISQRNNIPRIRKAVEVLCKSFGDYLTTIDGNDIYSFPTKEQLKNKDLSIASLGYREKYIQELCEIDDTTLFHIQSQDDITAKNSLLNIKGIGEKVANCVMLFGLHRMDSYPIDVWIDRLIKDVYDGSFNPEIYKGYAGYVQQLQFYYYRSLNT